MSLAVSVQGLTRDFENVRAVDDVSFEVERGAIFGFLGPNGAGKTTTIRMLLGVLEPTAGSAYVLGYDVRTEGQAIRTRAGALMERDGLYERLSAYDNLDFFARAYGMMNADERARRIREVLEPLGLYERRDDRVGEWSKGMRQKLAVARALLHKPSMVFLDEPTAGLDPVAAAALREALAGLVEREEVTVFLNTHNLAEAEKLCTQVGIIQEGKLVATGSPEELRARANRPRVIIEGRSFSEDVIAAVRAHPSAAAVHAEDGRITVDLADSDESSPLVRAVIAAGGEVEEVHKPSASLEETFMQLVEAS